MAELAWLLLTLVLSTGCTCQHFLLLRPVPGDSLPVVELQEDPDPLLDPTEKDLNETALRGALGAHFDARVMSVHEPGGDDDDADADAEADARIMPEEIRAMEFEAPRGKRRKPSKKLRRRLQVWLWTLARCPVTRAWSDLGGRFWPRYVKAGGCSRERSCSMPEGMHCRPARSSHLTLLRWRCLHRKAVLRCAWIPVRYPVVSECKCACAN
ncbi:noggin-3 [Nerophis lumbriciformis]|uniref:noggin-3 n=1 Tax=Nerophis lumbriciformis TaxID=546530 RepID=UPI002ADFD5B5|nr:noggin-3-like [Nerophis lumbriciformis]